MARRSGQSEALTRAALIDPLLRELGWDTKDPAMVMPEYRLGRGFADYALLSNGKPIVMVEAKKMDAPLHDAASQGIGYCIEDGIGYFAVTDGRQWEIYETHKMAPIAEKMIVRFDMTHSLAEACLKALALWRPAVKYGRVMAAETPVVVLDAIGREAEPSEPTQSYSPAATAQPEAPRISERQSASEFLNMISSQREQEGTSQAVSVPEITGGTGDGEWIPLSDLSVIGRSPPPAEIQFPDNSLSQIRQWNGIVTEAVRWLQASGYLNSSNWRVRRNSRYVVSDSPKHPNGKGFTAPQSVDHLYVETNYSAVNHVKNACLIIEHTGQDPAQFKVRFAS